MYLICIILYFCFFFFFKQKTAYEMRISDWSSDVCSSDLHYLQIIANRAPIGFEAEFVGTRGNSTRYRGILMPFSSDEDTIDFIYGVINWKELVDAETQKKLNAEVRSEEHTSELQSLIRISYAVF